MSAWTRIGWERHGMYAKRRTVNGQCADVVWSGCYEYRYVWRLRWDPDPKKPPLLVTALIPSNANEDRADETVGYCMEIAKAKGFGELVVVNMFARYGIHGHRKANDVDLVGPDNDEHISEEAREIRTRSGGKIVVAWGDDGWSRHGHVLSLLCQHADELWCFGTNDGPTKYGRTKKEFPYHPSPRGALRTKGVAPKDVRLKSFYRCPKP